MIDIIEAFFKVFFEDSTMEKMGLFFGGILFCLVALAKYYRIFERVDTNNDVVRENIELLKDLKRYRNNRDIERRIAKGENIDSGEF